jgi:hypothetical protein
MTIEGLPDSYCDVQYADSINSSAEWTAASDTEKEGALQWGRVYFDDKYVCDYWDTAPSNVLTANAMLGDEYLIDGDRFFTNETPNPGIKRKHVKAGDVESTDTYQDSSISTEIDIFPRITALVGSVCHIPSSGFGVASVLRR